MRLKLDENLGRNVVAVFVDAGHDVATVHDQGLASASDVTLITACSAEQRALVTLDLDFANPLRFDPSSAAGIAVLRVRELPHHSELLGAASTLAVDASGRLPEGRPHKLEIDVRRSLLAIAGRIDDGYNISVRTKPLPEAGEQPDDPDTAELKRHVEAVETRRRSLDFMNLTGSPILSLPESARPGDEADT